MTFNIRVLPKASRCLVKVIPEGFKVYLTRPAQDGLANEQLIDLMSRHLHVKKYQIRIIKGLGSRSKVIEVTG
jgi:uncharacterized protein YggU (UPF0235/DUF167 family)